MDISRVLTLDAASKFKKGRTTDTPYEVEASGPAFSGRRT